MRQLQGLGLVLLVAGMLILFLLRGPLYEFIVVVINLLGIFVGILLMVIGIALVFGGGRVRRGRPWGWSSTAVGT